MGVIILIVAALLAFALGGALVLLFFAWRRTEQHRAALLDAMVRIDQLERMMSAITFGAEALPGVVLSKTIEATPPPPALPPSSPTPDAAPPPPPAVEDASATDSVAARVARAESAKLAPPRADIAAAVAGVVSFAALGAAGAGILLPLGGGAIAAVAGAITLGMAEWRAQHSGHGAPRLVLFGLAQLAAAIVLARVMPFGFTPLGALIAASTLGLGALALQQRHGLWPIWAGLAIGLAAPLAAPLDVTSSLVRHGGLIALVALVGASARARGTPSLAWAVFAGAIGWALEAAFFAGPPLQTASSGAYAAALGTIGLAYAWDSARAPLTIGTVTRPLTHEALLTGLLAVAGVSAALALLATRAGPAAGAATFSIAALAALSGVAAAYRPGLLAAAFFAALGASAALAIWPIESGAAATLTAAGAVGAAFVLSGAIMLVRGQQAGAALGALGATAALVAAQARAWSALPFWAWSIGAAVIALVAFGLFWRARKAQPFAAQSFVTAAALALVAGIGFLVPAPWPPLAVALAMPALAWSDTRFNLTGLRTAIVILAAFFLLQLAAMGLGAPTVAARNLISIVGVLSIFAAARSLASGHPQWLSGQLMFAAAFAAGALALILETRRAEGVDLRLIECGLFTLALGGVALLLARAYIARPRAGVLAAETLAIIGMVAYAAAVGLVTINPWWGAYPAPAIGWPIVNALALAYLAPAAVLLFYAWMRQGMPLRAQAALAAGLTLGFLYVLLELRRAFHGPAMAAGAVYPAEGWAYAVGGLGYAAALLLLGLERGPHWLRYASLGLALAALAKAIAFDLGVFDGLLQLVVLGALVGAGVGIVVLYRRYVLPLGAETAKTSADPEPTPPQ